MDLRGILLVFWRFKWIILITLIATLAVVALGMLFILPTYTATVTLRIASASGGSLTYSDYMYADRLMNTYARIAASKPVLDEVVKTLNLTETPEIKVEIIENTELLKISVDNHSPELAQIIANTLGSILVTQSQDLYLGGLKKPEQILAEQLKKQEDDINKARIAYEIQATQNPSDTIGLAAASRNLELEQKTFSDLMSLYQESLVRESIRSNIVSIMEPAVVPVYPSKPNFVLNMAIAAALGLLGGAGLALVAQGLDTRIHSTSQVEAITQAHILANIPNTPRVNLIPPLPLNAPANEALRRLRANLFSLSQGKSIQTILITSVEAGEGKSILTSNLADTLSQTGKKVLVLDCDLRSPSIHTLYNIPNDTGLTSVLRKQTDWDSATQNTKIPGVQAITSGPLIGHPNEYLGSHLMESLLVRLRSNYDFILIDSPDLKSVADAAVLAPTVDGVLLVVRCHYTHQSELQAAWKQLNTVKTRILGVVMTQTDRSM